MTEPSQPNKQQTREVEEYSQSSIKPPKVGADLRLKQQVSDALDVSSGGEGLSHYFGISSGIPIQSNEEAAKIESLIDQLREADGATDLSSLLREVSAQADSSGADPDALRALMTGTSHNRVNADEYLKSLNCNAAQVICNALSFICVQSRFSEIDVKYNSECFDVIIEKILNNDEVEIALDLKRNLDLTGNLINLPGSTYGIKEILEVMRGQEELVTEALVALKALCETSRLHEQCHSYLTHNSETTLKAINIILQSVEKYLK